jgi:hypothetical protein
MNRGLENRREWRLIFLVSFDEKQFPDIPKEHIKNFVRPIVEEQNPQKIYEAIGMCFEQIGIKYEWVATTNWMTNGGFEIYVPPKNN